MKERGRGRIKDKKEVLALTVASWLIAGISLAFALQAGYRKRGKKASSLTVIIHKDRGSPLCLYHTHRKSSIYTVDTHSSSPEHILLTQCSTLITQNPSFPSFSRMILPFQSFFPRCHCRSWSIFLNNASALKIEQSERACCVYVCMA